MLGATAAAKKAAMNVIASPKANIPEDAIIAASHSRVLKFSEGVDFE